jgi:hypothetical protein
MAWEVLEFYSSRSKESSAPQSDRFDLCQVYNVVSLVRLVSFEFR